MTGHKPGSAPDFTEFLSAVADRARAAEVFEDVVVEPNRIVCTLRALADDAAYRVEIDGGRVFVAWVSPNRWMSQSIEAELKWTGDDLQELIEDECRSFGYDGPPIGQFEHFRSESMLYTFRSRVPLGDPIDVTRDAERVARCLLGYEATFRELGDMRRAAQEEENR